MKHITKERLQLIKQINTIFTSLTEIYNKTEEITEKGILVLGAIGGGKSALVASLINHELKIIYNSDKKVYQLENFSNSDLKIHNNPSTTTNILNKYKIGDTVIWDCPGFEINKYSPRNITQILINLFSLKRLFKVTNELQFIIVTPESSITEESGGFYLIIEKFTNIFLKSELEKLKNSVALVITKGEAELENINESVRNIINKSDPTIQKFFNNLSLSGSSFIKIFHKIPQETGLFTSKIKFEDFKLEAVNVKLRPLNFSLNGHQNIISELYTKIELNIAQISDIITRTFDEKNFDYYKPVNCRIFFDDYDSFIKKILLPSDKNYILLPSAKPKYFQGLQQIFKFHELMEKNNDNPKNLVIELLDIIEKFSEEPQQQEQIHNYSYILKQQTEYLLFFGEILKAAPSDSDYLFNRVIKHCKTTVNKIFMPFIKDIKLKKSIDDKYYEEAIWWLNKYKPPEEISETKALARFNIGTIYSKKGELRNAWDNFNQALNYNKKLILPYKEIGNILEQLAIKPNKNDDYYKVTLNLAIKYYKIADYDTGILKCFEALIKKNPKDPDLYIQKGDYLLTKKIYSDALKAYSAAKDITDNSFKRNDIALKILKFEISKTEPAPIIDYGNIHVAEIDKAERDLNFVKITGDNNANLG